MEWNDEEDSGEDVGASAPERRAPRPISVTRQGFYMTYLSAIAVLVLVAATVGVGFVWGHYVDAPAVPSGVSPTYTVPPSNGSSGSPGLGITFPNFNEPSTTPSSSDKAAAKIAKQVDHGLVDINTNISYQDSGASGTGMILSKNGLVLTNNHVIEGATSISVRDIATDKTYTAKVLGYDLDEDVALLKLENASGLTTVNLGDSSSVSLKEQIVAIGNAGGTGGAPSYVTGSVVAKDQSITAQNEENPNGAESLSGLIETNAPIEPGDSGGPLVTLTGKVVGIDTAAASNGGIYYFGQSESPAAQAYSIPINTAVAVATSIEKGDATTAIHIGPTAILGVEVDAAGTTQPGTPTSTANGITVATVISNTPAASAGLAAGDVITSFDGHAVSTTAQLSALEYSLKPGATATITYVSTSGTQETLSFALTTGPAQ
ncbi:MAG: S1C family serine protease [Acidimicrobiales bacterium]